MKYIIINTKNNFSIDEIKEYYEEVKKIDLEKIKFILCLKDEQIGLFNDYNFCIGSQDVNDINKLLSNNITHTIVGHASLRSMGEDINIIKDKIILLQENNIKPLFCIGESLGEDPMDVIKKDLDVIYSSLIDIEKITICYEPFWAIGKDVSIDTSKINDIAINIKSYIFENFGIVPNVVYGGNVNINNIDSISKMFNYDGYMISSGAINTANLKEIIKFLQG